MPTSKPKRTCHHCHRPVEPRGPVPADGLSTCTPCRRAGIDPRDIQKADFFDRWVRECVVPNEAAVHPGADVHGAYLAYVIGRDADWFYGRPRFFKLLEERGLGHRVGRTRWGGIDAYWEPVL